MKKTLSLFIVLLFIAASFVSVTPETLLAFPSVYPTATTIYKPEKCWNGYTIFNSKGTGAILIDMNGNVVKIWKKTKAGYPYKILPGGYVLGATGAKVRLQGDPKAFDFVQLDWDGNIVWKLEKAGQHHDFQREGNPVGYYTPGMDPLTDRGKTLILANKLVKNTKISEKVLLDDYIYEVNWDGKIVWDWLCSDHFDELGFSEEAKKTMYRNPNYKKRRGRKAGDWIHMNAMSYVGPNKWYDAGDKRFHPDNILWGGRQANIIAIIDKKTGKIVWQVGPDYSTSSALRKLGQIIGQHHPHMIPKGLPGEGNILVFDNGGGAGYGLPNPGSPTGLNNAIRDYSRIIEFNPVTLEVVWEYSSVLAGNKPRYEDFKFYSPQVSSAQRLPNGNTLITEGNDGRLFEITPQREIVWEYVSPYFISAKHKDYNRVYRAYRVPYDWIPQLKKPVEKAVIPSHNSKLSVLTLEEEEDEAAGIPAY